MDPGTPLAIISLAIQLTEGLVSYYELWRNAARDTEEIQKSIIWTQNLLTQLAITLQKENLPENAVSLIRRTVESCEANISKLQTILDKIRKDGTPEGLRATFRTANQKLLYMFHSKTTRALMTALNGLKNDLELAVSILNSELSADNLDGLQNCQKNLESLKLAVDESATHQRSILEGKRQNPHDTAYTNHGKDQKSKERYFETMRWLAPPNVVNAYHTALERREIGTGHWFLHSGQFETWRTSDASCLWLHGDVGCGKTILCAAIIEEISTKSTSQSVPDNLIYFYFAFDNVQCQSLSGFLRSMLSQLCPKDGVLPQLAGLFKKYSPEFPSSRELRLTLIAILRDLCGNSHAKQETIAQGEGDRGIQELNHTFLVLDALDEIPYARREPVLKLLQSLSELQLPRLHILVTSRAERDIESGFVNCSRWRGLTISRDNVQIDINIYISSQIEASSKLQSQSESIKEAIKKRLVTEADGMFRWSALQMEVLKSKRILRGRDILKILATLPPDLDATYERILTSIDSSFVDEAVTALKWLTCASRPMFLEELVEACIIQPDEFTAVENDRRFSPLDILEILPGLVRIEPDTAEFDVSSRRSHTITLSHFSVKEYLLSSRIRMGPAKEFSIDLELAQYHLTRSCLAYVLYCQSLDVPYYHQTHPLGDYAHSRWPLHLAQTQDHKVYDLSSQVIKLFRSAKSCLRWIESTSIERRMFGKGHKLLMLKLPSHAYATHDWTSHYLLSHSIASKNTHIVRLLLNSGLRPHSSEAAGYPLKIAAREGDLSMIQLLLSYGASHEGALLIALRAKHEAISRVLLAHGAQVDLAELLIAAKHASKAFFALILSKVSTLRTIDAIKVLDAALGSQNHDSAVAIFQALLQHKLKLRDLLIRTNRIPDQGSRWDPFLDGIISATLKFNSTRTIDFVLRSLSRPELGTLNIEALFLESVVAGSQNATRLLSDYPRIPVSPEAKKLMTTWESLSLNSRFSTGVIAMHDQFVLNSVSMPEGRVELAFELSWRTLHLIEPDVVDRCLQHWPAYHRAALSPKPITQNDYETASRRLWKPWRPPGNIRSYIVLSGPYSSFLTQISSLQIISAIDLLEIHHSIIGTNIV
ncbi:hypothetical protein LTR84_010979 [Exophiala bonariae]|uniref:Nephrocystin 3-like N-terminal domain-containing protein n=1 Tax=Exophiala bonariae TaxID=1690606 RepID=A0AAV9NHX7_9EURO|nr:hypothetical protein LTR84_010979 [Exophiala bonariae]